MSRSSFVLSPADIEVDTDNLDNLLGKGGFGEVYKGHYRLFTVAIKQLLIPDLSEQMLEEFSKEAEVMAQLRHPHIIEFYGFTRTAAHRIVMQFMSKGSLFKLLHSKETLSWVQRQQWATEVGLGLHYLHTLPVPILHRDLKSLNVLVDQHNQSKLTDFGLAMSNLRSTTKTVTKSKSESAVSSLRWMAPELFSLRPKYSEKSDIYVYAMVMWELSARKIPYAEVSADSIMKDAVKEGEREQIDSSWPEVFQSVIAQSWAQDPSKRPSAKQVVEALRRAELTVPSIHPASGASVGKEAEAAAAEPSRGYALSSKEPTAAEASSAYVLKTEASAPPLPPRLPPRPSPAQAEVAPQAPVAAPRGAGLFASPAQRSLGSTECVSSLQRSAGRPPLTNSR